MIVTECKSGLFMPAIAYGGGGGGGSSSGGGSRTYTISGVSKSGGFGGKTYTMTSRSLSGDLCALSRGAIVAGAAGTQLAKDPRAKAASAAVAGLGTVGQNAFCK